MPDPVAQLGQMAGVTPTPGADNPQVAPGAAPPGVTPGPGGPMAAPGGAMPGAPQQPQMDPRQVAALLQHLHSEEQRFGALLKTPGLGKADLRPKINEIAADMMGEGNLSLPQIMNGLNDVPQDPIKQSMWVKKKVNDLIQAQHILMQQQVGQGTGDMGAEMRPFMQKRDPSHLKNAFAHFAKAKGR